jgi:hypothetical protein
LKEFLANGHIGSDPVVSTPRLTRHPTKITKVTTLTISLDPCLICDSYYANHEFVVASYNCLYHPWCITVHVQLFDTYAKVSCGKPFDHQWCIQMGYKLKSEKDHQLDEHMTMLESILPTSYM